MRTKTPKRPTPFHELILAWRKRHTLTQAAAAAALGVPHRTWQDWEYGRRKPRGLALDLITQKLNRK
jgi:DNA-binding transcriptional regulator YiaG